MKSFPPLAPQGDRGFIVLGTGHQVKNLREKQVQQRKEAFSDVTLSSDGRSRLPVAEIQKSNDRKPTVLDPGKTGDVGKFHVEQHEGLGQEAGHILIDKVRCLRDYTSGITRCILHLYRSSVTKMVDYSISVVAVEPRLACLNRYPSCSAESTSFLIHGSNWPRRAGQLWSRERII